MFDLVMNIIVTDMTAMLLVFLCQLPNCGKRLAVKNGRQHSLSVLKPFRKEPNGSSLLLYRNPTLHFSLFVNTNSITDCTTKNRRFELNS